MPDLRANDRPKISLEQLLKLKRSERPDAAFWEDFDRELRRRQLASVVSAPSWRERVARSLLVGLRRAVPVCAAAGAAVGGFWILQQRPAENAAAPVETVATAAPVTAVDVAQEIAAAESPITRLDLQEATTPPAFVRPATSAPQFVVHEFAAATAPTRNYVSVTTPTTFSSPAYQAGLQAVNTLSNGYARRVTVDAAAGNF